MKVTISKGKAKGIVQAPPSKSMAHRLLICAGLAQGTSVVHGIAESEDVLATIDCLKSLGAECEREGDTITVTGTDVRSLQLQQSLYCRESGSTLRFFVPLCLIPGEKITLEGAENLMKRPMGIYKTICEERGLAFSQDEAGITVKGPLKSGVYTLPGNVSSQFISGLLFAMPLLEGDSVIRITPPVESRSYINMTIAALAQFGVDVLWQDAQTLLIKGGQSYMARESWVEGDYSNAAFFEALNAFGGEVEVRGLDPHSIQGDKVYRRMFEQLKAGRAELSITDCPDLGPVLFAVAGVCGGGSFTGTSRLRIKESDRGNVMAQVLARFGVRADVKEDEIEVYPGGLRAPEDPLYGYNDHRIVMSEAVLMTITGGTIEGAEAVSKSFPDFFDKLREIGIEVKEIEDN